MLYLSSTSNHNYQAEINGKTAVVLYLSSTSNHNLLVIRSYLSLLCYIFLLHQTTTGIGDVLGSLALCYIFLLHQTTTHYDIQHLCLPVVLYLSSTSNHNLSSSTNVENWVVLYLSSTSNHNPSQFKSSDF